MKHDRFENGLVLTLALNSIFWVAACALTVSISFGYAHRNILLFGFANSVISFATNFVAVGIGLAQLFYLVPIVRHYRRKNQWEVVKGISVGAILTVFVNSTCYGSFTQDLRILIIESILIAIILYAFNRRSRRQ
jgi:hypothetical protein